MQMFLVLFSEADVRSLILTKPLVWSLVIAIFSRGWPRETVEVLFIGTSRVPGEEHALPLVSWRASRRPSEAAANSNFEFRSHPQAHPLADARVPREASRRWILIHGGLLVVTVYIGPRPGHLISPRTSG